jgi:hypothetical protein
MVARNCDLARLAASAASLARTSEAFASSASRLWRMERSVVLRNSCVARSMVMPNSTASTASGTDLAGPGISETTISEPSCSTLNSRKLRPAIDMKKAAVATEPATMTT